MTDYIALARECGAYVNHSTIGGDPKNRTRHYSLDAAQLAAFAARIAQAAPAPTVKGAPCKVGDPAFEAWAESSDGEYDCTKITNEHIHATAYTSNDTLNAFRGWRAALSVAPAQDREDALRLDSRMIAIHCRDEFGEPHRVLHFGIDLRAAIDEARASKDKNAARQAPKEQSP